MLDKYKDCQSNFYCYFMNIFSSNRFSHAYLIETNNVSYGYDLAVDLAKFLLCGGVYNSKICDFVDSGNCPNFVVIGDSDGVRKDEVVFLKNFFSMKSSDGSKQVYIIRDVSVMNKASANSLLKFLEEPPESVVAILLCNSVSDVLSTIVSRCQVVRLVNNDDCYGGIFRNFYDLSLSTLSFDDFCRDYGLLFFRIYSLFESDGCFVLSDDSFYDLGSCCREFLLFGLYLYFDILYEFIGFDKRCLPNYFNFDSIIGVNDISSVIRKIDVINRFLYDVKYNVNMNLFLDNFIICMDGR